MINEKVRNFLLSSVGFDGGDLGNPNNQSVWLCGIEWGGGYCEPQDLLNEIDKTENYTPLQKLIDNNKSLYGGYENKCVNFAHQFNRKAIKLLASLFGIDDVVAFNKQYEPFVKDKKGFFKLNLFPISFKSMETNDRNKFLEVIGFKSDSEYKNFCRNIKDDNSRFSLIKKLREKYEPKIIICVGKTVANDFVKAFLGKEENIIWDENKDFYYEIMEYKSGNKGLFVITRFLGGPSGLNSDQKLKECGKSIAKIAKKYGINF